MTSRENKYFVEISFDVSSTSRRLHRGTAPYVGSSIFEDDFEIFNDKIKITASRSAVIDFDSIFYNHSSSLYNQIIKALIYYYASTKKFIKIRSLKISRYRNGRLQKEKEFSATDFSQVLNETFKIDYTISNDSLLRLFTDSRTGQATLFALSYILKAKCTNSESERFEKLWKAFNRLFFSIGNDTRDFTCLRNLRQFVFDNPAILPLSTSVITDYDAARLRSSIRWREMLLDNYATEASVNGLRDFVLRYNDKRIMEIILNTNYGYRETFLRNRLLLTEVQNHITATIGADIKNDNEVITVLTGKYMYFVRNKTFHGEKIDSAFRLLANKEDKELRFLNSVLEPYLIDLINANNLY